MLFSLLGPILLLSFVLRSYPANLWRSVLGVVLRGRARHIFTLVDNIFWHDTPSVTYLPFNAMSHPRIKVLGKPSDVPEVCIRKRFYILLIVNYPQPNDHQYRRPVKRLRITVESEDDDENREELSRNHSLPSSLDSLTDDDQPEPSTSKAAVPVPPKNAPKKVIQAKTKASGPQRKKPRKLVVTDPESEDYDDFVQQGSEEDDEHESVMEDKRPKGIKGGKAMSRKEVGARKGVKRLHKTEPSNVAEAQPPITKGDATLRPAPKLHELLIDVVGGGADEPQAVDSPLANADDPAVSAAKKRTRLPTIKKNKVPTLTAPSTPSTPAIASKLDSAIPVLKVGEPKQGAARAAAIAATDLDLANKSVYNELFRVSCFSELYIVLCSSYSLVGRQYYRGRGLKSTDEGRGEAEGTS